MSDDWQRWRNLRFTCEEIGEAFGVSPKVVSQATSEDGVRDRRSLTKAQRDLLQWMRDQGPIVVAQLQKHHTCSPQAAQAYLLRLEDRGLVKRVSWRVLDDETHQRLRKLASSRSAVWQLTNRGRVHANMTIQTGEE